MSNTAPKTVTFKGTDDPRILASDKSPYLKHPEFDRVGKLVTHSKFDEALVYACTATNGNKREAYKLLSAVAHEAYDGGEFIFGDEIQNGVLDVIVKDKGVKKVRCSLNNYGYPANG